MNGKRARALRRLVYGDKATNAAGRTYARGTNGGLVVVGRERREYQALKRGVVLPSLGARLSGWTLSDDPVIRVAAPAAEAAPQGGEHG